MDLAREEQLRQEFRDILFELAELQFSLKDAASRSKMYQRLEKLYYTPKGESKYRHFYSDIFIVLTQIQQGDRPGSIDILGQNLAEIRKGYQACNVDVNGDKIDIRDALKKLYDHVSLDIARITYSDWADRKVGQRDSIVQVKATVSAVQASVDKAKEDLESVQSKVGDAQKEYIAILGIFASVVLTFTGGIAFSTSVLENMHLVSIYRIIIVALIIGLVLINVLYGLFYYVSSLVYQKDVHTLSPLRLANGVFLLLITLTVVAWYFGFAEYRNSKFDNQAFVGVNITENNTDNELQEDEDLIKSPNELGCVSK